MENHTEPTCEEEQEFKSCPYCAERIQAKAVKCRYCGEFLDGHAPKATKWYYSTPAVVIALLTVGPLALPLVWANPRYRIITKMIVTAAVIVLTIVLCRLTVDMYNHLIEQVEALGI